jgi:hypothetical protein
MGWVVGLLCGVIRVVMGKEEKVVVFFCPLSCKRGTEIVMFSSFFSIVCRLCVRERVGKYFVVMAGERDSW